MDVPPSRPKSDFFGNGKADGNQGGEAGGPRKQREVGLGGEVMGGKGEG